MGVGKLIAFAGLPSSGKSSTAKALGRLIGVVAELEPEESAWPDLIRNREQTGFFTALTWFRTVRVPQLYLADDIRKMGGTAIIDSYYDVMIAGYLGDSDFEWLISPNDPYFAAAKAMVEADWLGLPKADVLIFLELNEVVWHEFVDRRDRDFDRSAALQQHFNMQSKMKAVCSRAAKEHGTKLIVIDQRSSSPEATAIRVRDAMKAHCE